MVTSPTTTLDSFPHGSFLSPSDDIAPQPDAFLPPSILARVASLSPRDISIPAPAPRVLTRSQIGSFKPKAFPYYHLYYSTKHPFKALHYVALPPKPSCYLMVASNPNWRAAIGSKFDALMLIGTWSLFSRPMHKNVIRNKWVFKLKTKVDGIKARLVAKGFDQRNGVDYSETFSHVIKLATICLVLALAMHFDWPIKQLDLSNAFLDDYLDEEVFMEQPQGFVDFSRSDYVCHLHKVIYGLK